MRRFLVSLRDKLDEKLHPGRRRRARQRLQAVTPRSVLFVCLGNICRSPYAQRVLMERAGTPLQVESAGFIGPGRAPPEHAMTAARARGIQHGDHRSKVVTSALLETADVIFVFDRRNARCVLEIPGARADRVLWLGDFDPQWDGRRAILDPWGKPIDDFERTFARIDRCVEEVLGTIVRHRDSSA